VLDRNPCGSSSGSAAAAAANLASVTVGTETDGSIVCPAGLCGVVGHKPTLGLVSRSGIVPISSAQDTAGPMTRTVTDAAVLLGVLAGADPADAATEGSAAADYTAFLDPDSLRGKRIGVWLDLDRQGDPGSAALAVFNDAVARLCDLGATAVPVSLPYLDVVEENEFTALEHEFKREIAAYLGHTPGPHPGNLAGLIAFNEANAETELAVFGQEVFVSAEAKSGSATDPEYIAVREAATSAARRSLDETLAAGALDAIVTLGNAPAWLTADSAGGGDPISFQSSTPAAVSGYPSVIVPMGFVGPLPVGLSFIGPKDADGPLLGLAFAFEQATRARRAPRFLATE
jgi:amidase